MQNLCPVCYRKMSTERDCIEGTVCEESIICPNGCYRYEFAYGSTQVFVGEEEFDGHYTDTPDEFRERQNAIKTAIQKAKGSNGNTNIC